MKRWFVFVIAAGILTAAIPAEAAPDTAMNAGKGGRVGRPAGVCFTSKISKRATTCTPGTTVVVPFWLP